MGIETYNADPRVMLLQWCIVLYSLSVLTQRKQQSNSAKLNLTEHRTSNNTLFVCFCDSVWFNHFLLNTVFFGFGIILTFCCLVFSYCVVFHYFSFIYFVLAQSWFYFNWTICEKTDMMNCTVSINWRCSYCVKINLLHLIFKLEIFWPFSWYFSLVILYSIYGKSKELRVRLLLL